jgi:uncharacterized protein YndB with AHSA1/START domain
MSAKAPRSIETQIEINAPIDDVWKALADAEELSNWFPIKARIKPGAGGSVWSYWADDMQWESPIDIWEEPSHMRVVWMRPGKMGDFEVPFEVAVDYHLEARGGTTVLRLVHTGFSPDATWDNQYDGTRRGWDFQLPGLKHYLERHRGTKREVVFVRRGIEGSFEEAWSRLTGPGVLAAEGTLKGKRPGDRLELTTATGDRLVGTIQSIEAPKHLTAFIENLNDAYMRVAVEMGCQALPKPEVSLWLSTYGLDAATREKLESNFKRLLEGVVTAPLSP